MRPEAIRKGIYRRLDNLRRRYPAHYAQVTCCPAFPLPPAWVEEEGPNSPWWGSQEARDFYESINERHCHG